jgi:hypothetical protein
MALTSAAARSSPVPLPGATVEACFDRWQGGCVELNEFLTTVALSSWTMVATSMCLQYTALSPPRSPAVLLVGTRGACLSFAGRDEYLPHLDLEMREIATPEGRGLTGAARLRVIDRGLSWAERELGERPHILSASPDNSLGEQANALPHLRRALDHAYHLERTAISEAERDPEFRRLRRAANRVRRAYVAAGGMRSTADVGPTDAADALEEAARRAAIQRARGRLLGLLDNQRLMGL